MTFLSMLMIVVTSIAVIHMAMILAMRMPMIMSVIRQSSMWSLCTCVFISILIFILFLVFLNLRSILILNIYDPNISYQAFLTLRQITNYTWLVVHILLQCHFTTLLFRLNNHIWNFNLKRFHKFVAITRNLNLYLQFLSAVAFKMFFECFLSRP